MSILITFDNVQTDIFSMTKLRLYRAILNLSMLTIINYFDYSDSTIGTVK
jgi:hypothetical protein